MKKIYIFLSILICICFCCRHDRITERINAVRKIEFSHGGRSRTCLVYVPRTIPGRPCPLLIVLHGGFSTAEGIASLTKYRFNRLADAAGFYVAYPAGLRKAWNARQNDPDTYSVREKIDDVGFISALIDRLAVDYSIDKKRVFAVGFSNGGFMCYYLACALSDKIRGIAAVSANHQPDQENWCRPSRPMNIMIMNGTDDPIVPYDGGDVSLLGIKRGRVVSTDDTVRYWTRFNACAGTPEEEYLPDLDPNDGTRVTKISYRRCGGVTRVVLIKIQGGGHTWPGGNHYLPALLIGHSSGDINACDEIWNFFSGIQ